MKLQLVQQLLSIPSRFYALQTKSFADLIIESGYLSTSETVSVEALSSELAVHPELVDDWLLWSEDKRTPSGWYFVRNEDQTYSVGYYPAQRPPAELFADGFLACATFIINELRDFAEGQNPTIK